MRRATLPQVILEGDALYRKLLGIHYAKTCDCPASHLNCLTAKDWMKSQLGIWQFAYEGRDIRDKSLHPATFPISLAKKIVSLFTHEGELVVDPFVGSGTTLVAAQDLDRNAVGFDLNESYISLCGTRLDRSKDAPARLPVKRPAASGGLGSQPQAESDRLRRAASSSSGPARQIAVQDEASHIPEYIAPETASLIWTSPPYANLLNRKRKNKSRRGDERRNEQLGKVEQYSQDPRDLGTMPLEAYARAMGDIFRRLLPLLRPKAHCVINVPDMWWENQRITIHVSIVEELRRCGYELRNIIIWDRTNIVNRIGIFGWPSNYITMGTTYEYLLDFWRPPPI